MFKELEIRTETDIREEMQSRLNTFTKMLSSENGHVRRDYNNYANAVQAMSDRWESRFRHLSSQWKQEDWRNKCGNMYALWIVYTALFFCLITSVIIREYRRWSFERVSDP
jgi:hypothetical protein